MNSCRRVRHNATYDEGRLAIAPILALSWRFMIRRERSDPYHLLSLLT